MDDLADARIMKFSKRRALPNSRGIQLIKYSDLANEEERIGVLALFISDSTSAESVNKILSEYASHIIGRLGLPHIMRKQEVAVISLIVSASSDEFGSMSGKLGQLPGVEVKSLLSKHF